MAIKYQLLRIAVLIVGSTSLLLSQSVPASVGEAKDKLVKKASDAKGALKQAAASTEQSATLLLDSLKTIGKELNVEDVSKATAELLPSQWGERLKKWLRFDPKLLLDGGVGIAQQGTSEANRLFNGVGFSKGLQIDLDKKNWGLRLGVSTLELGVDQSSVDKLGASAGAALRSVQSSPWSLVQVKVGPTFRLKLPMRMEAKVAIQPGVNIQSISNYNAGDGKLMLNDGRKALFALSQQVQLSLPLTSRIRIVAQGGYQNSSWFGGKEQNITSNPANAEFTSNVNALNAPVDVVNVGLGVQVALGDCETKEQKKQKGKDEFHAVFYQFSEHWNNGPQSVASNFRFVLPDESGDEADVIFTITPLKNGRGEERKVNLVEDAQQLGYRRYMLPLLNVGCASDETYLLRVYWRGGQREMVVRIRR